VDALLDSTAPLPQPHSFKLLARSALSARRRPALRLCARLARTVTLFPFRLWPELASMDIIALLALLLLPNGSAFVVTSVLLVRLLLPLAQWDSIARIWIWAPRFPAILVRIVLQAVCSWSLEHVLEARTVLPILLRPLRIFASLARIALVVAVVRPHAPAARSALAAINPQSLDYVAQVTFALLAPAAQLKTLPKPAITQLLA